MTDVFISRPNWIQEQFQKGIDNFYTFLNSKDLSPRTIGQSDYPNECPMDAVISLLSQCKGTLVLGIPQIEITKGRIKEKNVLERVHLSTEWNHIETALAYALKHPILVIHHNSVSRGIFDRGTTNSFLYSVDMNDPSWSLSKEIAGSINSWKGKLLHL